MAREISEAQIRIRVRIDARPAIMALDAIARALRRSSFRHYVRGGWKHPQHELTTGHHEHCPARYYPDVECAGSWRCVPVSGADVVAAGYLGQVLERIIRNMAACSCEYVIHTASAPIYGARRVYRTEWVVATGFQIDPFCPHHGRLTAAQADRLWEIVLTEEETHADPG